MAKQTINTGSGELAGDGESIRSALIKVNSNFDELYARAVNTDAQTLALVGDTLTISGGNSVDLGQYSTFSGSYNDLTNKPAIPADISDLTDTTDLLGSGTGDITFANSTVSAGNEDEIVIQAKDTNNFATAKLNLEPVYGDVSLSAYSSETVETFTLANGDFASGVWQDNGFGNGVVSFTGAQNIGDFFQNTLMGLTPENVSITINSQPAIIWNGGTNGSGTATPGFGTNPTVPPSPITITSIVFRYRTQSKISVNQGNSEIRLTAQSASLEMSADQNARLFADYDIEIQSGENLNISAGLNINISNGSNDTITISTGDLNFTAFDDVNFRGSDSFRLRNTSASSPIRIITDDNNTQKTWAFNADGNLTLPGNLQSENAINIDINLSDSTLRRWRFGEDGQLTFPDGTTQTTAFLGGSPTGDITFDGVKIQGAGTASGDGLGYSTIELVPDTNLYANNQYIVVDPTGGEPGHIHLRAGGTQDASSADLYLGGELTNVRVSDTSGFVTVRTTNVGDPNITMDWTFETDGNLYFPGIGNNRIGESEPGLVVSSDNSVVLQSNNNGESKEWLFGTDGNLTIPGNIRSESGINIDINLSDSTLRRWRFGEDGVLNAPGDISIDGGITGTGYLNIQAAANGSAYVNLDNTDHSYIGAFGNLYLLTDEDNREWVFGTDGTLTTPGDITVGGDVNGTAAASTLVIRAQPSSDTYIQLNNIVDSIVKTAASLDIVTDSADTAQTWTFGTDGSITFPDTTAQTTAFTTSPTLNVLKIDNGVHEKFQTKTGATGTVTHDCSLGHIFYHTLPSANWTVNLTNLNLALDYATSVTIVIEQGATGYYPNAIQIDGNAVGLAWQGNTNPTPSSSRTDVVTFSILYDGLYTVLGQLTGF